jgi:RHS repeat-associated protein
MSYDAAGNQINDGSGQRTYDAENRMLTATNGVVGSSYTYDADGNRVRRIVGGVETWQIYGIGGELLAEYLAGAASSSPQKEYGYRSGQLLVVWDGSETGDRQLQWLVQDHLGSTRMVVDRSGSLGGIRRHDFAPFGEELFAGAAIRSASNGYSGDSVRQKFGSKERDNETGLDYFGARYFGNTQGRFTSVDPFSPIVDLDDENDFVQYLGQPQNWNRYAYVWNNPLTFIDPDGEEVYVVTYTTGNTRGDDDFRRAAETRADEIRKKKGFDPTKDTVLLKGVRTKDDFRDVLKAANALEKTYGKVEQVSLFAHAGPNDGPAFHAAHSTTPEFFTKSELAGLSVNWSGTADARFYGCRTSINFAQNFANAQGVPSYGYDRFTYFSSDSSKREGPKATGPLYSIAADGMENGTYLRHITGYGRVYPMVRRDPVATPAPTTKPRK